MRGRSIKAVRWFRGYLVVLGVLAVGLIVGVEALYPDGWQRFVTTGIGFYLMALAAQWAERQSALPAGGRRRVLIAGAIWFLLYLVGIGPLVRWQYEHSLLMWTAAATVMALPFFVAAIWKVRA
ncbi:hypothetical protein CDO52_26645 [Nocardiopsis gilva YIM 90087]|uniref:Uncharacterized protein n=2 Tax=Nocardiopsis gilva TaxID=280236 RepID=A0A223SCK3_9ACTN|nr:hypothetical protein CDO52_26645 [Nocardiopsis gilva YIM 90087]